MKKLDYIVVGGGISGLSLAYHLKEQGKKGLLLEKSARLGGVIQTIHHKGFLIETGPNTMLATHPKLFSFFQKLGIQKEVVFASEKAQKRYIWKQNQALPLPTGVLDFLTTSLFSLSAKWRILGEPFVPKGRKKEETLSQFVQRRLGREFLEYAVQPFVSGVFAGDAEKLLTKTAFPRLYSLEQKYGSLFLGALYKAFEKKKKGRNRAPIFSFRKGMEQLVQALSHSLAEEIQTQIQILSVSQKERLFVLDTSKGKFFTPYLILAIPPYAYSCWQWKFPPPPFCQVYYAPVAVVFLGYAKKPKGHPLDGFGILLPPKEKRPILGILWNSSLFPERAPEGGAALTVFLGGALQPKVVEKPKQELLKISLEEVKKILGFTSCPTHFHIHIHKRAIPQYDLNHFHWLQKIKEYEEKHPGLFFTGNFREGLSVSDCVLKGMEFSLQSDIT